MPYKIDFNSKPGLVSSVVCRDDKRCINISRKIDYQRYSFNTY